MATSNKQSQPPQPAPASAMESVSDGEALARAQIARLRSALETIRDYPIVEVDMELGHQVAGMAIQAEVALDEVPSKSGLLTILADKLTTAQAELETLRAALSSATAREAALRTVLEFYAKPDSWVEHWSGYIGSEDFCSFADNDKGNHARKALATAAPTATAADAEGGA